MLDLRLLKAAKSVVPELLETQARPSVGSSDLKVPGRFLFCGRNVPSGLQRKRSLWCYLN
jgi:hypothetical protein